MKAFRIHLLLLTLFALCASVCTSYASLFRGPRFVMHLGADVTGRHYGYIQWDIRMPRENAISLSQFYANTADNISESTVTNADVLKKVFTDPQRTRTEIVDFDREAGIEDGVVEVRFFHPDSYDNPFKTFLFEEVLLSQDKATYRITEHDENNELTQAWYYRWKRIDQPDERGAIWISGRGDNKNTRKADSWREARRVWNDDRSKRIDTFTIRKGEDRKNKGPFESREETIWERQDWGQMKEVVQRRYKDQENYVETIHNYYPDEAERGSRRNLRFHQDDDGYWEYYEYNEHGLTSKTVSSYQGSKPRFDASGAITNEEEHQVRQVVSKQEDISGDGKDDFVTEILEYTQGELVSREYGVSLRDNFIYDGQEYRKRVEIRFNPPHAEPDSDTNYVTRKTRHYQGIWDGRLRRVIYPDGTAVVYEYSLDGKDRMKTVSYRGVLEDPSNLTSFRVVSGVRTERISGPHGRTIEIITTDIETGKSLDEISPRDRSNAPSTPSPPHHLDRFQENGF